MAIDSKGVISEWRPVSELRKIEQNISGFGYIKEFIDEHRLHERKSPHCSNVITGQVDFFEPIEVKEDNGTIFYRENENHIHMDVPKIFETQYGTFNNHNNGEFSSWLEKDDPNGLPEKDKELYPFFGRDDFNIEGNFCDMFDCGKYTYAVSNLMHMGLGLFKIIRIGQDLEIVVMYDNSFLNSRTCLEYGGRFKTENGYVLIASGYTELECGQDEKRNFQHKTFLFQIDNDGNCGISQEWKVQISSPNSIAVVDDYAYFGQNKVVTRLNLITGELIYFTNKNDEELAALKKMW